MLSVLNKAFHLEPYPGNPLFNDVCDRILSFGFNLTYLYYISLELLQKDPYARNDFISLIIESVLENNSMTDEMYATYLSYNPNERDISRGVEMDIRYLIECVTLWFRHNPNVMRILVNANSHGYKLEVDRILKIYDNVYSLQCKIVKRD